MNYLLKSSVASALLPYCLQKFGWVWEIRQVKFKEILNEQFRTKTALCHVRTQTRKKNWVPVPELPQTSFVILGKPGNIQGLQFPLV